MTDKEKAKEWWNNLSEREYYELEQLHGGWGDETEEDIFRLYLAEHPQHLPDNDVVNGEEYRLATEEEMDNNSIQKFCHCGDGHFTEDGKEFFDHFDRNNLERCAYPGCRIVLGGKPDHIKVADPTTEVQSPIIDKGEEATQSPVSEKTSESVEMLIAFGKSCFYKGFEKSEKDDANCFTAWREEAHELLKTATARIESEKRELIELLKSTYDFPKDDLIGWANGDIPVEITLRPEHFEKYNTIISKHLNK